GSCRFRKLLEQSRPDAMALDCIRYRKCHFGSVRRSSILVVARKRDDPSTRFGHKRHRRVAVEANQLTDVRLGKCRTAVETVEQALRRERLKKVEQRDHIA